MGSWKGLHWIFNTPWSRSWFLVTNAESKWRSRPCFGKRRRMFHCVAAVSLRISTKPRNREVGMKNTQIIIQHSLRTVRRLLEIRSENNSYKVNKKVPLKQGSQECNCQTRENNRRVQTLWSTVLRNLLLKEESSLLPKDHSSSPCLVMLVKLCKMCQQVIAKQVQFRMPRWGSRASLR